MKKKIIILLICMIMILQIFMPVISYATPEENYVHFEDDNLKTALINKCDSDQDEEISKEEIKTITSLELSEVSDLTGLEYAENLSSLKIVNNQSDYPDFEPLYDLSEFENLTINGERKTRIDFSEIMQMTSLKYLNLQDVDEFLNCENLDNSKLTITINSLSLSNLQEFVKIQNFGGAIIEFVDYNGTEEELINFMNIKKQLQNSYIALLRNNEIQSFGDVVEGETITVPYEDLIPGFESLVDKTINPFDGDYNIDAFSVLEKTSIEVDKDNEQLVIKGLEPGEEKIMLNMQAGDVGIELHYSLNVISEEDEIVKIPDHWLNEILLAYDTNGDSKLTKGEMKQVTQLTLEKVKDFTGLESAVNLTKVTINTNYELTTKELSEQIEKIPSEAKILLTGTVYLDVGGVRLTKTKDVQYSKDPILNAIFYDTTSRLYTPGTSLTEVDNDNIAISNSDKKITLKGSGTEANKKTYPYARVLNSTTVYQGVKNLGIYMRWNVLENYDDTNELTFVDDNLKQQLLEKCDLDKDGIITEADLRSMCAKFLRTGSTLDLRDVYDLTGLEYLTKMEGIEITGYYEDIYIDSLEPLQNLTNLKQLYIRGMDIETDISVLSNLTNLETLHILAKSGEFREYDLEFLQNMNNLKTLIIYNANNIKHIEALNNKTMDLVLIRYEEAADVNNLDDLTGGIDKFKIALSKETPEDYDLLCERLENTHFGQVMLAVYRYDGIDDYKNMGADFQYDIGDVHVGDVIKIKYEDLNDIIKNLIDENYYLYSEDYSIWDTQMAEVYLGDKISFNNDTNEITIKINEDVLKPKKYLLNFTSSKAEVRLGLCMNVVEKTSLLRGDIDKNGKRNLYDAFTILRMIISTKKEDLEKLSEEEQYIMDFDENGKINLHDAFTLLRYVIES